jgi:DNA invertase Pin-like site-specific DNA recombinase
LGKSLDELENEIEKAERNFNAWKKHFEVLRRQRDQLLADARRSKPRGRKGGRKPALTPEQITLALELINYQSAEKVAARFKVSTRTLERYNIRPLQSVCDL